MTQPDFIVGNARREGNEGNGWFMGYFMPPDRGPLFTHDIEVKWGTHKAGDRRADWGVNPQATTISILISGRFQLQFRDQSVILQEPGDYALWQPNVAHTWLAETDCTILSIRYPSVPTKD